MRRSTYLVALTVLAGFSTFVIFLPIPSPHRLSNSDTVLGSRTKSVDCQTISALPDPNCTPGVALENIDTSDICQPDFPSDADTTSSGLLNQLLSEYRINPDDANEYVVDHLISVSLGGSNDLANLWPQRQDPRPGYHEKDRVEQFLKTEVCAGRMSLQEAQKRLADNWVKVFLSMPAY